MSQGREVCPVCAEGLGEKGCLVGIFIPLVVLDLSGAGSASCSLSSWVASRSLQNTLASLYSQPSMTVGERSLGPGGRA